jgi:predicted AlkP superfamily phosphohydrolase/phosphomutase
MKLFRKGKDKRRVCVVGLDGTPHSLITRFMADGTMPSMAKIASSGQLSQMKVTLPEISSVSWSSFMTGANPGTHGIMGFVDLKAGSYEMRFPSFRDISAPTFWDKLGERGKTSVVINQPSTYPARSIPGVLVAGFVALEMNKAVFPMKYVDQLEEAGYKIDIDTMKARTDHDFLFRDLYRTLQGRRKAVDILWRAEDWDYFEVVVTGTDRLHHYLWDALDDPNHQYHSQFREYYQRVDSFIGEMFDRFLETSGTDGEGFFMLSDHGFTALEKEVYLNAWLQREGYLSFRADTPDSLTQLAPGTRAFAMDPGRIFINLDGKYPDGSVADKDADPLKAEIIEKLKSLEFEGEPVIRDVFRKEDIYSGSATDRAADLIALSYDGFDLKGSVKKTDIFMDSDLKGMHNWDDAFFWSAKPVKDDLNITDLASIITEQLS